MKSYSLVFVPFVLVATALSAGCGNTDPGGTGGGGTGGSGSGGTGGGATGPFLPLAAGNRWTYLVTELNDMGQEVTVTKVQTVMPMEPVGGTGPNKETMAYRMVTTKGQGGTDETISWQARVGDRVVRYREQSFGATSNMVELEEHWDPYKLRLDESAEHTVASDPWQEMDWETKIIPGAAPTTAEVREVWKVTAAQQAVTVQGKQYDVMIVTKTSVGQSSTSSKTYWWARGIGKVKEIRNDQVGVEELVSYELQP